MEFQHVFIERLRLPLAQIDSIDELERGLRWQGAACPRQYQGEHSGDNGGFHDLDSDEDSAVLKYTAGLAFGLSGIWFVWHFIWHSAWHPVLMR
jgi:hypothetical protein